MARWPKVPKGGQIYGCWADLTFVSGSLPWRASLEISSKKLGAVIRSMASKLIQTSEKRRKDPFINGRCIFCVYGVGVSLVVARRFCDLLAGSAGSAGSATLRHRPLTALNLIVQPCAVHLQQQFRLDNAAFAQKYPLAEESLVRMADPFEVRMRFSSQLQHLNASVASAQKAAQYALKYKDMDEDLHSCILEQVERVSEKADCAI